MVIGDLWKSLHNIVEGTFTDLSVFDFNGVYILCDRNEKIVYVGSAYARTIKTRLQQYLRENDSGNTLGKTIAKGLAGSKKYDAAAQEKMDEAISIIKELKIYAIKHKDLEYRIISQTKPQYNNMGKYED